MPAVSAKEYKDANEIKGRRSPDDGEYHLAITAWDETQNKHDAVIVTFTVLDGDPPGMAGREWTEFFNFTNQKGEPDISKLVKLCLVTGMLEPGQELNEDLTQKALGRQLVGKFEVREFIHKTGNKAGEKGTARGLADFGYAMWSVNDPLVSHVKKNPNALRNLNATRSNATQPTSNNGNGSKPGASSGGWDDV